MAVDKKQKTNTNTKTNFKGFLEVFYQSLRGSKNKKQIKKRQNG